MNARRLCLRTQSVRPLPRLHDRLPWRPRARPRACRISDRAECCRPSVWEHATGSDSLYNENQSASRSVRFRSRWPAAASGCSRALGLFLLTAGPTPSTRGSAVQRDDPAHRGRHGNGQKPDHTADEPNPTAGGSRRLVAQGREQATQSENHRDHHRQQECCHHAPGETSPREFRETSIPHTHSLSRLTAPEIPTTTSTSTPATAAAWCHQQTPENAIVSEVCCHSQATPSAGPSRP